MESSIADLNTDKFNVSAYQLLEKIGEGGFGRVYRAKQTNTGQIVAIKFLLVSPKFDEVKKKRYIERFERETLLGSRLQHPNIVRLLDKGSCDDLLYAVFEYVDGKTLKQTLAESGALLPVEAAEVMTQVLDALAHAHQQGVLHRDIKPANIMLSKSGATMHAKVLDFGIGTLVNEARLQNYKSITLTQETLGTPSYSAPEQLRGEPPTLKTDLYVWGLVFIECLTGKPAMSGSSIASIFHKQLSQSNVPLPNAIIGHPVSALLRRVLQKKAHERSVNANELYKELSQINFSNIVGEIGVSLQQGNTNNDTVLCGDFDETIINDEVLQPSPLTERKQVTVLSICLTAHSLTSEVLDHEVLDALLRDQKNQCVDTAIRYSALHVGSLGDTLLFYFGYPVVSDNDSRLCARTALDIVSCLHNRNALLKSSQGVALEIRGGIHTGLMTCYADAVPEGNTANIAMQLARIASQDQILCSASSQKLLESYIEFKPALPAVLGVEQQKTPLFCLTAERFAEAFGFLRAAQNNHAFIGRQPELELLTAVLHSAHDVFPEDPIDCPAVSKFVHIYGEAGIGKSRLLFEFRNRAHKMHHYVAQCLPEHVNNALYPILNMVKYKYSFTALSPDEAVQKLRCELAKFTQLQEQQSIPVLCSWLDLPLPEGISAPAFSPNIMKRILFASLTALLISQDTDGVVLPNLFLFEDMHWADPTSIEFIAYLNADSDFGFSKDIFVSTSRQPLPQLLTTAVFQEIQLVRLSPDDTRQFVCNLFDKRNVSDNLLDVLKSRTDGIPLFIEELVNMLKQNGLIQHLNGIVDFVNAAMINKVPSSLRDSLQQKLDTLVYAKDTVQLAATLGRTFDYDLLVVASSRSEGQLQMDLSELIEAGLIYQQRKIAGDSYVFKHALVRDAAYECMTADFKMKKHQKVAQAIESLRDVNSDGVMGLLAGHCKAGELFNEAAKYSKGAAEKAMAKSLYSQSIVYAQDALESLNYIDSAFEERLQVNQTLTTATMMVSGWASPEVNQCISDSEKYLQKLGGGWSSVKFQVHWALATYKNVRGYHDEVVKLITNTLQQKEVQGGDRAALLALQGHAFWQQGKLQCSLACTKKAQALYQPSLHSDHATKFGHDTKVFALALQAMVYSNIGNYKKSRQDIAEAEEYAHELHSPHSICMAKLYKCCCLYHEKKTEQIKKESAEIMAICKKQGIANWLDLTTVVNDWAGSFEPEAIYSRRSASALKNMINVGMTQLQGFWNAMVAETQMNYGEYSESLGTLQACLAHSIKAGDALALPILQRLIAECYEHSGNDDAAGKFYAAALSDAQRLGMEKFT